MPTGSEELQQLRHFAKRRLANPHGQQLCHYLDGAAWEEALHDRLLVPEEMSLGFYLGRGLLNHQGKGFETQVASLHHGHPAFTGLSLPWTRPRARPLPKGCRSSTVIPPW